MDTGCRVLLLLGALLGTGRGKELSSAEERQALMLKHLQEVLQLPEVEGEGPPKMTLTELAPEGGEEEEREEDGTDGGDGGPGEGDMGPTQPALTTAALQPEEDGFTYVFSRLDSLDAAVHRLNVQFYTMDLRVAQFSQGLAELRGRLAEAQEALSTLSQTSTRNQQDLGKIDGCLRGRRVHGKCFLLFKNFEGYDGARGLCRLRGGDLAMPADDAELAALRRYLHEACQPFNWPAWVGIHDRRAEGLWLYENGQRVSFFDWYRDPLVSQPNGGTRENCVSLSSDDGKWWDNDCARRMYYICEYRL
ncbi:C-type lectin domain family 11 member A [Emydura macquarii macquarii]|uniref:C-type lectin domain family 11 member A n=1 Tax=Emydura macquarii macquarii TaxID=1129001 RepID=UPI00352A98FF